MLKRELPVDDDVAFFKRIGFLFHHFWLDHNVLRPMPSVVTVEGDTLSFIKVAFDVADPSRVASALASHPEIEKDDDEYVWHDRPPNATRMLGVVRLRGRRLTLETHSETRALRGRELLENLLGDAITYRATSEQSLESARADLPRRKKAAEPEIPLEVQQQVVGAMLEKHYRAWIDEPVPALGGRTPRHAAKLKTVRAAVVDLVKGIEGQMERARLEGEPAIDVSWMWQELGLERR